jgi:hypothetical protein
MENGNMQVTVAAVIERIALDPCDIAAVLLQLPEMLPQSVKQLVVLVLVGSVDRQVRNMRSVDAGTVEQGRHFSSELIEGMCVPPSEAVYSSGQMIERGVGKEKPTPRFIKTAS